MPQKLRYCFEVSNVQVLMGLIQRVQNKVIVPLSSLSEFNTFKHFASYYVRTTVNSMKCTCKAAFQNIL